jgi:hypothetical protein
MARRLAKRGSTTTFAPALRRLATLTEMLADEIDELRRNSPSSGSELTTDVPRAIGSSWLGQVSS